MKLSCCIFSAQYLPHIGGVEMYTYNLAKQLTKKGIAVTVVTSMAEGCEYVQIAEEGFEVIRLPSFQLMNSRLPVLKTNNAKTKELKSMLDRKGFDFVVVNTRFYALSMFGVKFAYENKIDCVVIEHGTDYLTMNNAIIDGVSHVYEQQITNKLKKYCHNFAGVSLACAKWLENFGIYSNDVIYNAIDTEYLRGISSDFDYRKEYNIPNDAIAVCFVGRIVREKGIENLIEAIEKINGEAEKKIYLLVAGDGNLLEKVKSLASQYVIVLGSLQLGRAMDLMRCCDIFCLPSKSEGFPTTVLEAVLNECFVVTTEKGGAKELISDESLGIIIKDNSVENIEKALLKIIKDEGYRQSAVTKSKKKLLEKFTWDAVSDEFIKKYLSRRKK